VAVSPWSADFVFDRTAEGRVLKCLTIVDDATTEAVAVVPARARALGGLPLTRLLDDLAMTRGVCHGCCGRTTAWSSAGARC
jgi:putative transposase